MEVGEAVASRTDKNYIGSSAAEAKDVRSKQQDPQASTSTLNMRVISGKIGSLLY